MLHRALLISLICVASAATASAAIDSTLLALVPPRSQVVAGVDVNRARVSPFGQILIDWVGASDSNFETFLSETGFDMRRDVQDFLFAASGSSNSEGEVLARGNFSAGRILARARTRGLVTETYRGVELILNSAGTAKSAMGFPAPGIAVIADLSTVEEIIRGRNVRTTLNPELRRLIENAGNGNDAWFASLSAGALAAPEVAQQNHTAASAIQTIQEASGGIRFTDPIPATVRAVTASTEEAEALSVVIRGMAALARMGHPADPYLAALAAAQNLNVAADGNAVKASFSISESDATRIAKSASQQRSAGRSR